ncbi:ATP-binding protein [Segetibacter sp.]|uniref:ATP-binding protein n=1 Tax=Segetibacter sp. TaxID=2231182 RepID=UPI0026127DC0|nr:ATP-binding protein [Segetibacter sp.]MCW3080501.1 hypothetical protein [Segetibacter sp.]
MNKTFKEFYQSFNLTEFPFNTFTTEHEVSIAKKIFISQGEYDPIIDAFKAGRNVIILGERGSGKTAILEDFKRHLLDKKRLFTIIHDYSTLKNPPASTEIYKILISFFLVELFSKISKRSYKLCVLNKEQKVLLSYLLSEFLPNYSKNLLKDKISNIQIPVYTRAANWLYNKARGPLNLTGTVAKNIAYQYLIKHYSFLPTIENENQIQQFFPELKLNVDSDFFTQDISFRLLKKVGEISNKLGYPKPVIFLDRLDEDQRFENDADIISDFISPFLTDGNLLSIEEFQLVFFVWSTPFRFIEDLVRTQKYYCPSLRWSKSDLEKLLNKRLEVYSDYQVTDYKKLFASDVSNLSIDSIFQLANANPRDLIHLFKTLFEEQYNINPSVTCISEETITASLNKFVVNFNYYEYYPRKSNARANSMDIYSYSAHLLKLENEEFTKNQLNERAGTGSSTNNYVASMEKIGLIENIRQDRGIAIYKIKDAKIVYSLKNKLELRKK